MVTIVDVAEVQKNDGTSFCKLVVQGGVEMVQSQQTGRFYATARKTSIPTTFTLDFCKSLVGQQMPGQVKKVAVDPYQYAVPETGEVLTLSHSYQYVPEGQEVEQPVPSHAIA